MPAADQLPPAQRSVAADSDAPDGNHRPTTPRPAAGKSALPEPVTPEPAAVESAVPDAAGTAPELSSPVQGSGAQSAGSRGGVEPWAQLVADPGHAPELLALAAVQTFGPRAAGWARAMRERYPQAGEDGLARLAERQFIRFGGVGSVFAAAAGSLVPVALVGANAVAYAELVLHVAAAYGLDPTDRERAVELLVLTGVHGCAEDAAEALAAAEQPAYEDDARLAGAVWRLGRMASAQAVAWALVRGVNRLFPGVTVLAAIVSGRSGVRAVGARSVNFYRRRRSGGV